MPGACLVVASKLEASSCAAGVSGGMGSPHSGLMEVVLALASRHTLLCIGAEEPVLRYIRAGITPF